MTPEKLERLETAIKNKFSGLETERTADALIVRLAPEALIETMIRFRDDPDLDFKILIDLAGVHYPGREKPLELVYQLLSVHRNHRLRVKVAVAEGELAPSVIGVWSSANWAEREAYEMVGVLFSGHPDLRRLLTEYDFDGHPLRKDFPVTGLYEVFYDPARKRVVRKPNNLSIPDRESYQPDSSRPDRLPSARQGGANHG